MFPDNDWYGHRTILHKYLGQKDKKIFASLQHGWISQYIKIKHSRSFYPRICWSKNNISESVNRNNKDIIAIGAPFLYLCKFMKKKIKKDRGTLIFLPHSTQDTHANIDHKKFAMSITKKFKKPYTFCFYYYDYKKKNIIEYIKNKWRVICCVKNRNDKNALYRLYNEINDHQHIVCGELNTALFYGMYLKKKTTVLLDGNLGCANYDKIYKKQLNLYKKHYPELFKNFLNPKKGYELSKKELGFSAMKNNYELEKILGCKSIIKKVLSSISAFLYDLKYGRELRQGLDLPDLKLIKYIAKSDNCRL